MRHGGGAGKGERPRGRSVPGVDGVSVQHTPSGRSSASNRTGPPLRRAHSPCAFVPLGTRRMTFIPCPGPQTTPACPRGCLSFAPVFAGHGRCVSCQGPVGQQLRSNIALPHVHERVLFVNTKLHGRLHGPAYVPRPPRWAWTGADGWHTQRVDPSTTRPCR